MPSFIARSALIAIVGCDAPDRQALTLLLRTKGFTPETFDDGEAFLEVAQNLAPSCVILDFQLPGNSGLDVLRRLAEKRFAPPVFAISSQPAVATAVEAMKLGARDFLEKPLSASILIDRVRAAIATYDRVASGPPEGLTEFPGRNLLTRREQAVLAEVAHGASSKEAGRRLGISPRTIEVHRARIMDKLGARNAADLMRIVLSAQSPRANARAG